jgi:PAS domain S-box-containing protein
MTPTLLLVDDEPAIADAIESSLLDEHYIIYKAGCAAEALSILEQHAITVVIADQIMPGMSGIDLCATVHQRWPTTYRILLSSENEEELIPASLNGDVHQYLAKPWDAMLLRYNINEGIRQQRILKQALDLRESFQKQDQACLITDNNWVIQLASPSAAEWLGTTRGELQGKNLFSRALSNNSIQQETQLINTLESLAHWQGSFHFNTASIHGSEAWMCIVPFAEQHYLCLAIPMIDDMLHELSSEMHHLAEHAEPFPLNTVPLDARPLNAETESTFFRYLKIVIDHSDKLNLDLITVINERLQLVSDNLYHVIATAEGDQLIRLPQSVDVDNIENLLANIHQEFIQPLRFHGQDHKIKWHSEILEYSEVLSQNQVKSSKPVERTRLQKHEDNQAAKQEDNNALDPKDSYYQPQHYAHSGFSCLPIFNQRGQGIALLAPACQRSEDLAQWLNDAMYCSQEWDRYCKTPVQWVNDFSEFKPQQALKALSAIVALGRQANQDHNQWWVILSSEQLLDIKQADKYMRQQLESLEIKLLVKNPDFHLASIKEWVHDLPSLFSGLCVDTDWLFDDSQRIKRHSMQLLNHLKTDDLLIFAKDIKTPQQLALLHTSPCHWLAGEILSVKLLPQQISWLHQ